MAADLDEQFRPPLEFRPAIRRISRRLFRQLVPVAHGLGYGLMAHGSLERDLDVVAVPWIEDAAPVRELVKALAKAIGGYWSSEPERKPHGRLAYTIILARGGIETPAGKFPFVDLSVAPLAPTSPQKQTARTPTKTEHPAQILSPTP